MTYLTQYLLFCPAWQTIISLLSFSNKFTGPLKAIPQGLSNKASGAELMKLRILETELSSCGASGYELHHCKDKSKQTKPFTLGKSLSALHRNSCSMKICLSFTLNMILLHLLRELQERGKKKPQPIFKTDYIETTNSARPFSPFNSVNDLLIFMAKSSVIHCLICSQSRDT